MGSFQRVRVGQKFTYRPVMLDSIHPPYDLKAGDKVVVVNLPGCPPANTMGHCYVNHVEDGSFGGLVCTNSLVKE